MKKTFPVNINGIVFYIDEDAYNLLNTYLDQLRNTFTGNDGAETVDDIESRIAEIFSEKSTDGTHIIMLNDVNDVIERMGRPDDIAPEGNDIASGKTTDTDAAAGENSATPPPFQDTTPNAEEASVPKKLYRDERNKVFGGVLAGFALYLGWNVTALRVIIVILALITKILPFGLIYLVAWMIIPPARTPRQILEMTGRPVTLESLGRTILGTPDAVNQYEHGSGSSFGQVLGKIIMAFVGLIGGMCAIGATAMFIAAVSGLVLYLGWATPTLIDYFGIIEPLNMPVVVACGIICMSLAILIPSLAAVWAGCNSLFNSRGISRKATVSIIIFEILVIIATIILLEVASIGNIACMGSMLTTATALQIF